MELAAFIAVPPALFYVLGFGALWVQLSNEYDGSGLYNTWYAASLVPRIVVAAYGASVIWKGLLVSLLTAFVLLLVAYWVLRRRRTISRLIRLCVLLLPLSVAVFGGLLWIAGTTEGNAPAVPTFRIVGGFLVVYFLLFYLFWSIGKEERSFVKEVFSFYPKTLYSVIAVASLLSIGASVLFPVDVGLPCLWRETAPEDVVNGEVLSPERAQELSDLRTLEGGFLAHSEGHWYVYDEKEIRAIPDDEATRVIEGRFYVAYRKIGKKGDPVGEEVAEEDFKAGEFYTRTSSCE